MGVGVVFYIRKRIYILLKQSMSQLWTFDAKSDFYQIIKKESRHILIAVHMNIFLGACMTIFHWPLAGQNDKIYYGINLFERILPKYAIFLRYIYYSTFPILCYMVLINPYVMLYVATHMKFQVRYINYLLENMATGYINNDYNLLRNRKYQQIISRQLKDCINRHTILK